MRSAVSYTPDRETDLLAFMCRYIKEDAEQRPAILEHLRCCMDGEPYPNPYLGQCGYTQADVDRCGKLLDGYVEALCSCAGDPAEIDRQVQAVLEQLDRLNERCSYSLIDDWREERLCAFITGAAGLAGATPLPRQEMG